MGNAIAETGGAEKMAARFGASETALLLIGGQAENQFLTRKCLYASLPPSCFQADVP
jgi:hypothetical protein